MNQDRHPYDAVAVRCQIERYLALGLHPIPLKGKVAKYRWKEFALTEHNIEKYLRPGVNWGLRTGQLKSGGWFYALDLDSKKLLAEVGERCPELLDAPIVSTGKGFHVYLTWKEEARTRHFAGVDIICNGYVVAPPSVHPERGKPYRFVRPLNAVPPLVDPERIILDEWKEPLPLVVTGLTGGPANDEVKKMGKGLTEAGVPRGQRHNALVRYLGILFNACVSEEEALALVLEWNRLNRPPLSPSEVAYTAGNCYKSWGRNGAKNGIGKNNCRYARGYSIVWQVLLTWMLS